MKASSCVFLALSGLALSALATPTVLTATPGIDGDIFAQDIERLKVTLGRDPSGANTAVPDGDTWGPNIGVLTAPYCVGKTKNATGFNEGCEDSKTSGFDSLNVKWLEQAGARVIPIRYDLSKEELDAKFAAVNGVLFTGGMLSLLPNTTYYKTAKYLFDKAIEANDQGDYFPVWGTCMGFQLLHILAADDYSVLTHRGFKSESIMMPLHFTREAMFSRMIAAAPHDVIHAMENVPATINWHQDGVTPEDFLARPKVRDFFRVISVNYDQEHKWFLSTVEARRYPIYGVQYHPEAVQFDWTKNARFINRSVPSIAIAQYLANFFVGECRKSEHRFASTEEEDAANVHQLNAIDNHNTYELYLVENK